MSCKSLKSIILPESVTVIGSGLFQYCTNLATIIMPDGLKSIEYSAFSECTGLTSIPFPGSLTSIEHKAFRKCTGLTTISFPGSLASIEHEAFSECASLTTISFPGNITTIGESAFSSCPKLKIITFQSNTNTISFYSNPFSDNILNFSIQTVLTNSSKDFFGEKSVYVHYKNITELTDQTTIDVLQYIAIEHIINPLDALTENVNDPIVYESDYSFLSILLIGLYS